MVTRITQALNNSDILEKTAHQNPGSTHCVPLLCGVETSANLLKKNTDPSELPTGHNGLVFQSRTPKP